MKLRNLVLTVLVVLALLEFGMDLLLFARRTWSSLSTRSSRQARWQRDDYLRGRVVPGQRDVTVGPSVASFNSLGFRGGEPQSAAQRIVCLGDSVTFGWGASRDQNAYPAVLQKLLAPRQIDVVNAGMPRWNSCDVMDLYVTRVIPLRPQIVVILVGWNDMGYELALTQESDPTPAELLGGAASQTSSTVYAAGALLRRISSAPDPEAVIAARETGKDEIHWERLDEYERIVTSLVQLVRQNGSQPVLVTIPNFLKESMSEAEKRTLLPHLLSWPDISYTGWLRMVTGVNGRIHKVAQKLAVPLADCAASVPSRDFIDLSHFNDAGYRALAVCVNRTVEPLVGARPEQAPAAQAAAPRPRRDRAPGTALPAGSGSRPGRLPAPGYPPAKSATYIKVGESGRDPRSAGRLSPLPPAGPALGWRPGRDR